MSRRLRFLVLDDSEEDRFLVVRELEREFPHADLERINSAAGLAEALERDGFDLVVTDYSLGWTDGIEVLRGVKARDPEVPVIMFTGTGSEEVAVEAMKEGLDDYILKSSRHVKRLSSAVRSALERVESRRRAARLEAERLRLEAELRRRADELAEEGRKKDEFLAILSHELRNPLAPIRNALHLLRRPDVAPEETAWALDVMDRQVGQMARLVDDLLDVSRIARGTIELRKQPLDLAEVARRAVESARLQAGARGHQVALDPPAGPVAVEADPVRLEQVLSNLLDNAVKYTDPGGRITVEVGREGPEAVVRVRDTGAGIAAGMLETVFEPFRRGDRSAGGASQWGLGIGLTLARSLVALHGGAVRAHSDGPGRGSEFTVRLPAAVAPAQPTGAGPAPPGGGGRTLRALVVDDSRDAADSLARLLRRSGHEVRVAYGGAEALDAAADFRPDVVLLDIGMPGMDGYEVARRLRERPDLRGATLVAVTGWGQREDRDRAEAAGFDQHVVKPLDPESLNALLASLRPSEAWDAGRGLPPL